MSIHAIGWALDQDVEPTGRKFVLVALANFADTEGRCYPSQRTLAKITSQNERTVRRHLYDLEHINELIKRVEVRRKSDGGRTTDDYYLQAPRAVLDPSKGGSQNGRDRAPLEAAAEAKPPRRAARGVSTPPGQNDRGAEVIKTGGPRSKRPDKNRQIEPSVESGGSAPADGQPNASPDHHPQEIEKTLKRHLGKLLPILLEEDPRRSAWLQLPLETVRATVATAGRLNGKFGTRLKELLDSAARLEPQKLEASGGPVDVEASRERARRQETASRAYEETYHRAIDAGVDPAQAEAAAQAAQRAALDPDRAREQEAHDRRNELYSQAEHLGRN